MSKSAHDFLCALVVYVEEFLKETMVDSFQCSFDQDRSVVLAQKYFSSSKRRCCQFCGVDFSEL